MSQRRLSSSTAVSASDSDTSLSSEDVATHLRQNPDFFRHYPRLLSEMSLPHSAGEATSLIERQVAILRERNVQTRHRLGELVDAARANDSLLSKTQKLIVELLDCDNLLDLLQTLHTRLENDFNVQHASVVLIDNKEHPSLGQYYRNLNEARQVIAGLVEKDQSLCGSIRPKESDYIFGQQTTIGSIGMANIHLDNQTFHDKPEPVYLLIAVGHSDAEHYRSDTGTLFLDYLSAVLKRLASRLYTSS